ncbi:4-diphosphocytidyl-2C-methyl-D-erythritol kinase, partial [Flavobacterium sp. 28A]|uniref:Ig-like domain-containing protein n=1 Tax=Flavobacterium sp. 28A TaxID=2735895 RepID=UPI00157094FC|nr:4-diphosphocytidyl-2C-methyl-D-erythritol kinase [Flavobacterium sp. 28A]
SQTLTATATGGTITWYTAATGGTVVTTPTQVGVGTKTYYAESSNGTCSSLTRTAVKLTINAAPNAPTAADQTVCYNGNTSQTLTATATGGTITWYTAATAGTIVTAPTQVGVGTKTYYAESSNGTCSSLTRTAVKLTINAAPDAPTAADQTVCTDGSTSQTLTATATGGTITWYTAATGGTVVTAPTQVGVGTKTYYAESSNGTCSSLTRTAVKLTINAAPNAPTATDQTVCYNGNASQTLTATATGGTITWYTAATGGTVVTTPTQVGVGTKTYYAESSNGTCSSLTRTAVKLTINEAPDAPTAADQTVCTDGSTSQTLTATATGGTITWYTAATGGTVVTAPTQVGVGTKTYYAESSNGTCSSLTRTAVKLTINEAPNAPVASAPIQPTCSVATGSVKLSGLPSGNWTITPGNYTGNTSDYTITGLSAGKYNFTVTNSLGCSSNESVEVVINSQPTAPAAPIAKISVQPKCGAITGTVLITSAGTGFEYNVDGGNYQSTTTFSNLTPGTHKFTVRNTKDNTCISNETTVVLNNYICAVDDAIPTTNGLAGNTNAGNVLKNNPTSPDTLNGAQATVSNVKITVVTPATPKTTGALVPTVNPITGIVSIPEGTPAGTYRIDYKICDISNADNCDDATVTIPVTAASIDAIDDKGADINGLNGGTTVANVLVNDELNGKAVVA